MRFGNGITKQTFPFILVCTLGAISIVAPFTCKRHNTRFKAPLVNQSTIPQDSVVKKLMIYGSEEKVYRGSDGHDYMVGRHWIHYPSCQRCANDRQEMIDILRTLQKTR
jgi:hypothetical protein